jgi:hypothetical protein
MTPTMFLIALGALVALKLGIQISVDAGGFADLPRPSQID